MTSHPGHHPHDDVVDPDVDLHDPAQVAETSAHEWDLLAVIAAGGVVGAEARYGLQRAITDTPGHFPWTTLLINVVGSFAIGVLMIIVLEIASPHRYLRPFAGVGILGGFTTYSTFAVDVVSLARHSHTALAVSYVLASFVLCCAATFAAIATTRVIGRGRVPALGDET